MSTPSIHGVRRCRHRTAAAASALLIFSLTAAAQPGRQPATKKSAPRAAQPSQTRAAPVPSSSDFTLGLRIAHPPPLRLPGLNASQLSTGLRLALSASHDLPLVSGWLIARAGSQYEAADRVGLAEIAVKLLRVSGVSGKSREEIDARLDHIGTSIEVGAELPHAWHASPLAHVLRTDVRGAV